MAVNPLSRAMCQLTRCHAHSGLIIISNRSQLLLLDSCQKSEKVCPDRPSLLTLLHQEYPWHSATQRRRSEPHTDHRL